MTPSPLNKRLKPLPKDGIINLPECSGWAPTRHLFDQASLDAIEAALAAQRPLLIRGEPGTGKSQLARAAAALAAPMQRALITEVVQARSESRDLLWRFDAVGRLGEAQAIGAAGAAHPGAGRRTHRRVSEQQIRRRLEADRFLLPGPLWWAFDWASAEGQYARSQGFKAQRPEAPKGWLPEHGCVVLIDEIDKADADLPNGLLETLGEGKFSVPHRREAVCRNPEMPWPLVVITTNEERELPPAFVRRCFVLHLHLPDEDADCIEQARRAPGGEQAFLNERVSEFLIRRGKAHFGACITDPAIYQAAATQVCEDRRRAYEQGLPKPGQAEYIDILRALHDLAPGDGARQHAYLDRIARFALQKFQPRAER